MNRFNARLPNGKNPWLPHSGNTPSMNKKALQVVVGALLVFGVVAVYGFKSMQDRKPKWITETVRRIQYLGDSSSIMGSYIEEESVKENRIATCNMAEGGWEPFGATTFTTGAYVVSETYYRREASDSEVAEMRSRVEKEVELELVKAQNDQRYKDKKDSWGLILDNVVPDQEYKEGARVYAVSRSRVAPLDTILGIDTANGTNYQAVSSWDDVKRIITGFDGKEISLQVRSHTGQIYITSLRLRKK